MTWRTFRKLCRRSAERVPYHPEAFIQETPGRPPQPLYVRFAALAGTAAILVVAIAAVLLSSLFQAPHLPAGPDGESAASPAIPPDVDMLYIYSCLAEMTYTGIVESFDATAMTAAQQLQYANQVYLRQNGRTLFDTKLTTRGTGPAGQETIADENSGTALISIDEAQAQLNRLFGPNAVRLSEQTDIDPFLSWEGDFITTVTPHLPASTNDSLTVGYQTAKRVGDIFGSLALTDPLVYYVESVEAVGTNVIVTTAAFAEEDSSLFYPTDLAGYNRLQSRLKTWSQTKKAVKWATYTFGSDNGTLYLLSCRSTTPGTTASPSSQTQPATTPTTEPVWTNPRANPPSLLDNVTWKGRYDPDPLLPLLYAFSLRGEYEPPFDSPEDKQAAGDFLLVLSGAFRSRVTYVKAEWNVRWEKADEYPEVFERLQIPFASAVSMPFDSLNLMADYYFAGLVFERDDLFETYDEETSFTGILYDAETDRAYLVCPPTGIDPNIYVIAGEEVEGNLVHYTLLGASGEEDAYSAYYESYGFAAVQRYLLDSYPFSSQHTTVFRMSVDMQSGRPRVVSLTAEATAGERLEGLLESARTFVESEPGDPSATREVDDVRLLADMSQQIKGMAGFFPPEEEGVGPIVRYQDLMACMTADVIGELEAQGYLESVYGEAVVRPLFDLYTNDWARGHVLSAARTDTDGLLDVVYTAPDFRYSKNRRFSMQMQQDENGVYLIASLPREIE